MRPYLLIENNWKNLSKDRHDLAVMSWGATEAHNFHLPYGTDLYEADAISTESARKTYEKGGKLIVLPPIPFGVNTGQRDIYLDINLNPSTQLAILRDILTVLNRQGVKKLLLINAHGGNDFKPILRELGAEFPEMFLTLCNFFQVLNKKRYFEEDGDHADEMETSLMMHLKPELVLPLEQSGLGKEKQHKVKAIREKWAWSERRWSEVSEDTGIGNPKKSTNKKGERFFNDLTDKLSELMLDLCTVNNNDLYEP